ncbi:ATP-grasp peptide maturase system methyltransferase [Streptomyces sp. NPDC014801]|uniref:ATP-grasp peptide maturase system methyltransferase n=1 Tax=Streptomyces sp. NPDC014801 TaxID=3364916 RepID=UPI0036FF9221
MTLPADPETDALPMRAAMTKALAQEGLLDDAGWRSAVATVPRHRFVPYFYLPADDRGGDGLTVWEPITADRAYGRWLSAAYSDTTLVTQFDGTEPDWRNPAVRHGGSPTSSSTMPSLVVRMWVDAEVEEGHTVLEIGTGTGYSTALACERLGSSHVTSIEVDSRRLEAAADTLHDCGYTPTLAAADGFHGYWPEAWFDRIVTACSFRRVPPALVQQTRPDGKILLNLSGWLYGHARVLLTVAGDGSAEGPLLPGTISFMSARAHAAPAFGNPSDWAAGLCQGPRRARHAPAFITAATTDAFHLRFLAQAAVPDAQLTVLHGVHYLIDVVSGSAAALSPSGDGWEVREGGPVRLWERVERVIDLYQAAGRPGPEEFSLRVDSVGRQFLLHPRMPDLPLHGR